MKHTKIVCLAIFLFFLIGPCVSAQVHTTTGNDLLTCWKAYEKLEDDKSAAWKTATDLDTFRGGFFIGYVSGVWHSLSTLTNYDFPDSSMAGHMCMVVGKYLNEHPEELHEQSADLVQRALRKAFPSKK